jgi:hypothetical protein
METTKGNCFICEGLSKSNVPWAINIKWQVTAKFNVPRLFRWNIATFEDNTQALSHFCNSLKIPCPQKSDLAFVTLQEQPFNLFTVHSASATRTHQPDGAWSWPIYGPEIPSQTTATTPLSDVRCVVLYYLAAGSNLTRDVQVSSYSSLTKSQQPVPRGVHVAWSAPRHVFNVGDALCIPDYGYYWGSWVFPPNSNLLCLRSEMAHPCINPVITDQETRLCLLDITKDMKQKPRNIYICALPSGISVHSVHILCGIPVLHGQWCRPIQFRWTTIMIA